MLKENCLKYTTNCSSNHPYAFIVRPLDTNNKDLRIMLMEITEEQENELDNNKSISIEKGSYKFNIEPDMCYAYGKLDLSPNSKDIENIYKANWFSNFDINIFIPSEYNYEDNSVTSDIKGGRVYGTSNVKKYLPFLYASINKPERVVIFKEYLNIVQELQPDVFIIENVKNILNSSNHYFRDEILKEIKMVLLVL